MGRSPLISQESREKKTKKEVKKKKKTLRMLIRDLPPTRLLLPSKIKAVLLWPKAGLRVLVK